MPFCTQCGTAIGDRDTYCASCGAKQGGVQSPPLPVSDPFGGISPRHASMFCYLPWIGWIGAVFVLASSRFYNDKETRFHAFQGLYLFVAWLLVDRVIQPVLRHSPVPLLPFGSLVGFLKLALFGACIFMIIKVAQNESFRLPFFGELADKSVAEQR